MNYEEKSKNELILLIKEKDIELANLKRRKDPGRKKFNDSTIIKLMYDMYLTNNSLQSIANFLNESKITTNSGGAWSRSSVNFILRDEVNIKKFLNEETYSKFLALKKRNTKSPARK